MQTPTITTARQRAASTAGHARAASMTPEERKAAARHAHLAGAVKAVVDRAPDLSDEQITRLRAVFGGGASK